MVALALPSITTITSAFLLKLTTSLDDLLWLSPFLSLSPSVQNKLKHSVVYFVICVVVTMLAFIFGTTLLALTSGGGHGEGYWNPERFLSIFSASVLFYIARNDYTEWKEENSKGHEKRVSSSRAIELGGTNATTVELTSTSNKSKHQLRSRPTTRRQTSREFDDPELNPSNSATMDDYSSSNNNTDFESFGSDDDSDDEEIRTKVEEASKSLRRFVTVCVMGTLDDMIVFSAFVAGGAGSGVGNVENTTLAGRMGNYLALFIGTTFAASLIVTISWFFSEIEWFKRLVKKIPMWALLTGIAVYILFMGLI